MEWAKAYPLNDRAEARVLLEDVRRHMNENMLLATNYNFITPRGVLPFMQARPIPDDAPIPLDKICDDPRQEFRSLWEIIKSERDFFLLRRGAHEERLGYAATLQWDRAERMFRPDRDQRAQLPKYAALVSAYQTDGSAGDRYGAFVMYWEPEVANRATYTPADSIAASGAAGINGVTGANNKLGLLAEASPTSCGWLSRRPPTSAMNPRSSPSGSATRDTIPTTFPARTTVSTSRRRSTGRCAGRISRRS
ncbi:hypothetical protein ACFQ0O_28265 [Saccharopolyspora spinosporotrichia]